MAAAIVVFDIETGGFLREDHQYGICEIALLAIDSETLEEVDRYEAIIAPYVTKSGELTEYTESAFQVHGIPMSKIEEGKSAKEVAGDIIKFLKSVGAGGRFGKPILSGHNIEDFDIPFVVQFMELQKKDLSKVVNNSFTLDTVWLTRLTYQGPLKLKDNSLGSACESNQIELVDAHRAMNDVEANAELVKAYIRRLRGVGLEGGISSEKKERFRVNFQF